MQKFTQKEHLLVEVDNFTRRIFKKYPYINLSEINQIIITSEIKKILIKAFVNIETIYNEKEKDVVVNQFIKSQD